MTRHLARLADISYRRRGRMVLAWIVATVVIIGVGSVARRRVQRRLQHARLGVQGREPADRGALRRLLRAGDLRRLEGPGRRPEPRRAEAHRRVPRRGPAGRSHRRRTTAIRVSQDGKIGSTTLPLTVAGWDVPKEDGEKLIAAAEEQQRRRAPDQARRRSDLRGAGVDQPRGARVPRRRDRAADRVRLGRRRRPAARDRARSASASPPAA